MLSDALAIIDRLIQLLKQRHHDRQVLFAEHIEPIFLDMTAIQADYRRGLEDMLRCIDCESTSLKALQALVREKKSTLEHMRVKVHALVSAWNEQVHHKSVPPSAADFFHACWRYFVGTAEMSPYRAHYTLLLEEVVGAVDSPEEMRKLRPRVVSVLDRVNSDWSNVTAAYAEARITLVK